MAKHVYIDLDGTLTDPFEGITKCIYFALEQLGKPIPDETSLGRFIGPPLLDTFCELVGAELAPQALEYYRERFGDIGWLENRPYDGIHNALRALNEDGHQCFVATTKPGIFAQRIVERFDMAPYFAKVYGSELDGARTDKTELLEFALRERSSTRESVMIGDRHHDIVGAVNNGLRAVGVTYGYGTSAELLGAGADCLASSPSELPDLV